MALSRVTSSVDAGNEYAFLGVVKCVYVHDSSTEAPCMYSVYMLGLGGAVELATARIMKSFGA